MFKPSRYAFVNLPPPPDPSQSLWDLMRVKSQIEAAQAAAQRAAEFPAYDQRVRQMIAARTILPRAAKRTPTGDVTWDQDVLRKELTAAGAAGLLPAVLKGVDEADRRAAARRKSWEEESKNSQPFPFYPSLPYFPQGSFTIDELMKLGGQ